MIYPMHAHFTQSWLMALLRTRTLSMSNEFNGVEYHARILIPKYRGRIQEHYNDIVGGNLAGFCDQAKIPFSFNHFGVSIEFSQPVELALHNDDMAIDESFREIMNIVGPVIIKNAYHHSELRSVGHRNRFPHLNFHVDRTANQPEHYSMYSRDPFDDEQQHPRTVSTLMCANIVGQLQSIREGVTDRLSSDGMKSTYTIFTSENMQDVFENLVIEQKWDAPQGTGEIAMQDNLTCLHASYYRNKAIKGYKIGVRYVQ